MSSGSPIAAVSYWEKRAREFAMQGRGLAAVCSYGMPEFYNDYIEQVQRRAFLPCVPHAAPGSSAALDVGCGVGRWSLELASRGHDVTGIDLSPYMIERARASAATAGALCSFTVGDAITLKLDRKFDLIVCVTVVQHILDAAQARVALARLAAHLAPGGTLLMLEAAPTRATARCDSTVFRARTLDWHVDALREAGLSIVAQRGVDPTPFKTWLLPYYRRLPKWLANLALLLTTAVALPVDWLAGRWLTRISWHKVLVAKHADAPP